VSEYSAPEVPGPMVRISSLSNAFCRANATPQAPAEYRTNYYFIHTNRSLKRLRLATAQQRIHGLLKPFTQVILLVAIAVPQI